MLRPCPLALAVLFIASPAFAQTDAENIQARVRVGQNVSITDDKGQAFNGRINTVTPDGLRIVGHGKTADVPYDHIVRIDRHDGLGNGALIGFSVGAGLGVAAVVAARSDCYGRDLGFTCPKQNAGADMAGALLLGGLGTAVGVGIDALIHHDGAIYQRGGRATVAPTLRRGAHGAIVSVSW